MRLWASSSHLGSLGILSSDSLRSPFTHRSHLGRLHTCVHLLGGALLVFPGIHFCWYCCFLLDNHPFSSSLIFLLGQIFFQSPSNFYSFKSRIPNFFLKQTYVCVPHLVRHRFNAFPSPLEMASLVSGSKIGHLRCLVSLTSRLPQAQFLYLQRAVVT